MHIEVLGRMGRRIIDSEIFQFSVYKHGISALIIHLITNFLQGLNVLILWSGNQISEFKVDY